MILNKVKAIAKLRGANPERIGKDELTLSIQRAEANSDCFGTAFPLLLRVRAMELERQGGRR